MKTCASMVIFAAVSASIFLLPLARGEENAEKDSPRSGWRKWIEMLPGGEQTKLRAVHAIAMEDPAVKAADEKRKQAEKEFHDLLRATMLKIDPSLQPTLDKMPEPKKHHHKW